jgi:multisubunit Na+/H+ antiporter MnhE subunit
LPELDGVRLINALRVKLYTIIETAYFVNKYHLQGFKSGHPGIVEVETAENTKKIYFML